MTKDHLLESASRLSQPGTDTVEEFIKKQELLLLSINAYFEDSPHLHLLIGDGNLEMMKNNHHNHLRFMASLFANYEPDVLVETVLWVFRAYRSHGFRLSYWPAQLDAWVAIFKKELQQKSFIDIYPFYKWMIVNNPIFAKLTDPEITGEYKIPSDKHD